MRRAWPVWGEKSCDVVEALGRATVFLAQSAIGVPSREGWSLWMRQMHFVGVLSLAIVLVSGLFIGMVLALQGYTILVDFGAEQALGQMVALSLLRELAPVVAALLFAGASRVCFDRRNRSDESHRAAH